MDKEQLIREITKLKKGKNAVIVAHTYQMDEVQDIADVTGDSFALSKYCANNEADIIVFCGVHFMAESAKILSPGKTVLLPEKDAGCPMADMLTGEDVRSLKRKHPKAAVVCYINSTAEVKAESDVCCTSSNAVNVVRSIPEKDVIFVPDQNLGSYVAKMVPEKNIILWEGYCITHHRVKAADVEKAKELHPDAELLVHPECQPEILEKADYVGSTKQIIDHAKNSNSSKFIIGTEMGVLYQLKKDNPDKVFYLLSQSMVCVNMKKTSLKSIYNSLLKLEYNIELTENIRLGAEKALNRMLKIN